MWSLIKKVFVPYERPEGEMNVFDIINSSWVQQRPLTDEERRQIDLANWVRLENHERICMIRGGAIIVLLLFVVYNQLKGEDWTFVGWLIGVLS